MEMHRILGKNAINEIFCCAQKLPELGDDTSFWCHKTHTHLFFECVLPSMAKGGYLWKDAVIWVPFLPWCLKTIYKSKKHYLDVFKIDFVTGSDKDQDELLKSKLDVMNEWDTLGKEKFKDEFIEKTVDGGENWQHFWEKMPATEFEKFEWMKIRNVHKFGSEK